MDWIKEIKAQASDISARLVKHRRHLHAHPELSFEEKETSAYIRQTLDDLNISYTSDVGGYGVVAMINGTSSSDKVVGLRADMDALPILEENECDYKSQNVGVMHACGHDVHTTCLLGAAEILQQLRHQLAHDVKLIFQPAEERLPGGASLMIKEGVLDAPKVTSMLGQHVHPELEVGKVGFRAGPMMASADELYIRVIGRGGHAALPHTTCDPIIISAAIITALQTIVSRHLNPVENGVLTIGKINSIGGATNIIPAEVRLEGTFRAFNEEWRYKAHDQIRALCEQIAEAHGARCEVDIRVGYPYLHNHEGLTSQYRSYAESYLGKENVVDLTQRMTAEDFGYFSHELPSCFYRLGVANMEKGITSPVHTSTFDVDEYCLELGAGLMAYMASQITY